MTAVRGEDGAGAVLAVAMMGLLVTVTVGTAGAVGLVAGHRRAQTAADLAALAGASALQAGGDPCREAAATARRNGAVLRQCQTGDWQVAVVVAREVRLPGSPVELQARGLAGPVTDLSGAADGRSPADQGADGLSGRPG